MEKIILDTDLGSDIDDSFAIAYLLAQKNCNLLGITTVSGEPIKRAEMASAICINAARGDIPIHPGAEFPLIHAIKQDIAHQYAKLEGFKHESKFEPDSAVDFLRKTIRENPSEITLVAIGALTNIAVLFCVDPEIPSLLKRLVIMGGHFAQENPLKPVKEWNILCDTHAANIVFAHAPKDFLAVGTDITMRVALPKADHEQYKNIPLLKPVFSFAEEWFSRASRVVYHDPLAVASIFAPEILKYTRGYSVAIPDGEERGVTTFTPSENGNITVASDVDIPAFFNHFYSAFEK